jgi:AcrR family transcriptional regulator
MAGKTSVKGEARQLILNAAEDLFARHGVEAVSLRTINANAGVSPGVLHYHFGKREVLVNELVMRHMRDLMAERQRLLTPLESSEQPALQAIVESLVLPLAQLALADDDAGPRYVRFIARLYADRSPVLAQTSQQFQSVNRLYPELLQRALPGMPLAELELRLAMANHAMLQSLADLTHDARHWQETASSTAGESAVRSLVDFICGGLRGTR